MQKNFFLHLKSLARVWFMGFLLTSASVLCAGDYSIAELKLDHADGLYSAGETVVCTGQLRKGDAPVSEGSLRCVIKWEGQVVETRDIRNDGTPFRVDYTSPKAGWVYFGFMALDAQGKLIENAPVRVVQNKKHQVGEIGAMYDVETLRSPMECPEDFDDFWRAKREMLWSLPLEARCERLADPEEGIELYAVEVPLPGEVRPATGYLAMKSGAAAKSLPLYMEFLSWMNSDASRAFAVGAAKKGALAIAATWHGFPVGKPQEFYTTEGKSFNYLEGMEDRDKWVFQATYFRVLRMLAYAKSLPQWNQRDLIVQGGSLGGAQSACAAALDPDVTLAIMTVPAFGELNPGRSHRKCPTVMSRIQEMTPEILKTLSYYDTVNFMARIQCECYVATGFVDELVPPSTVVAGYHAIPAGTKKTLFLNPRTGHYGTTVNVPANKRIQEFFQEKAPWNRPEL